MLRYDLTQSTWRSSLGHKRVDENRVRIETTSFTLRYPVARALEESGAIVLEPKENTENVGNPECSRGRRGDG